MKYLLDTNIVSELMKPAPDSDVVDWVNKHNSDTVLCSMVLSELAAGVEALDEGKRKSAWKKELGAGQKSYEGLESSFYLPYTVSRFIGIHSYGTI